MHPDEDAPKDHASIIDVSGDGMTPSTLIGRLAPGGDVVLAGVYEQDLGLALAPAFIREAQIRIAAQCKKPDLHANDTAFGDPQCLKMMIDWRD